MTVGVPQFAWMAGILDLKGRLRRVEAASRRTPLFKVMVESQHLGVVRRLADYTATRPSYAQSRPLSASIRRSCKDHCPEPHKHVQPQMPTVGRWDMTGAGAVIVLTGLLPYIAGDVAAYEEFIEEATSFIPTDRSRPGRYAVEQAMKRLGKLGWPIPSELGSVHVPSS